MAVNENDPNFVKRKRAAKRSENQKAGKPVDDGIDESPAPESNSEDTPAEPEAVAEDKAPETEAVEPAVPEEVSEPEMAEAPEAEGGIVEAAEEMAEAEGATDETPAEEMAEGESEPMAEEAEPVTSEGPGEYMAPEGESHDQLIDAYHDALLMGDMDQARDLYRKLQDHRYQENTHRSKTEAKMEEDWNNYVSVAQELATKHPELNEEGLPAEKALALAEVYRNNGESPTSALQKAVADLYPEQPLATEAPAEEAAAPADVTAEAPAESAEPEVTEPEVTTPPDGATAKGLIPEGMMEERMAKKSKLSVVPSASARNQPPPPPETPTRESAIAEMKRSRGQVV